MVGLDPEEAMLAQAKAATPTSLGQKVRWIQGRAEQIPDLGLGCFQAVTLGQSFHWTDKRRTAETIYDCLEPGGTILLIHHDGAAFKGSGSPPSRSPHPPIPHEVINEALGRWLGHGKPLSDPHREPYADLLMRTRFGAPERLLLPGRANLYRTVDEVIDMYLSTSFAAPDLFGDQLTDFRGELADTLDALTDTGLFWEWPGDTEVLVAVKTNRL